MRLIRTPPVDAFVAPLNDDLVMFRQALATVSLARDDTSALPAARALNSLCDALERIEHQVELGQADALFQGLCSAARVGVSRARRQLFSGEGRARSFDSLAFARNELLWTAVLLSEVAQAGLSGLDRQVQSANAVAVARSVVSSAARQMIADEGWVLEVASAELGLALANGSLEPFERGQLLTLRTILTERTRYGALSDAEPRAALAAWLEGALGALPARREAAGATRRP